MTLTKEIRAWLSENPQGRLTELYAAFPQVSLTPLSKTLERLKRRGELALEEPGYSYAEKTFTARGAKQRRIWTVIRALAKSSRVVDPTKVRMLSETSANYCGKYLRWLEKQGYVASRPEGLAVLTKAMETPQAPHWHRRKEEGSDVA